MNNLKQNPASKQYKLLFVLAFIFLSCFFISPVAARSLTTHQMRVDSTSLKAFEGLYQQKDNQYMCFRITAVNDGLLAKQVDGDMQLKLTRKSDLGFEMPDDDGDEMIPVVFSKNHAGEIAQILVAGRQLWQKVESYMPPKEVKLTAEQLKAYEGKYQFEVKKDAFIQITATADGLKLKQSWDGKEVDFMSIGDDAFLNKQLGFPLKFFKDQDGHVVKVLAFNRDTWDKVKE